MSPLLHCPRVSIYTLVHIFLLVFFLDALPLVVVMLHSENLLLSFYSIFFVSFASIFFLFYFILCRSVQNLIYKSLVLFYWRGMFFSSDPPPMFLLYFICRFIDYLLVALAVAKQILNMSYM